MKSIKTLLILPLIGMLSTPVMAHHGHDGYANFDQRIERQHKRIKKGVRNDQLTKKEAKKLRKQHRFIKRLNRYFWKDGNLDPYERKTLHRELGIASDNIYRLRHNEAHRHGKPHHNGYSKNKRHGHYQKHEDRKHHRSAMLQKKHY